MSTNNPKQEMQQKPDITEKKPNVGITAYFSLYFKVSGQYIKDWIEKGLIKNTKFPKSTLFNDMYMEDIIKNIPPEVMDGIKKLEKFQDSLDKLLGPVHAVRERYFNKSVQRAVKPKASKSVAQSIQYPKPVEQVISLGVGFDTRKRQYPITFFDIDSPEIINEKQDILKKLKIDENKNNPSKVINIGMNYVEENLLQRLKSNGLKLDVPTHIILEGNVLYLPIAEVKKIIKTFQNNFQAHLTLSFDYHSGKVTRKETEFEGLTKMITVIENKTGKSPLTGIDDIQKFAEELGVTVSENHDMNSLIKLYGISSEEEQHPSVQYYYCCTLEIVPPSVNNLDLTKISEISMS